jgi:dTDP-4-dehydrorhamnose reductase
MGIYDSILVVGGYGMLAGAFKRALEQRKLNATYIDRDVCDITDPSQVAKWFDDVKPTVVLNCAAYTAVDKAEQEEPLATAINGAAVGTLARESRKHNAMLVHYSTDYVFDGTITRPLRPDDPVGPQSAYGRSKLVGEQLLQQNAPQKWLIIRTAWLYGLGGPSFPKAILDAARAGKPLNVVDDQTGSPTFTDDLAKATLELIDRDAKGIWHLVNDGAVTWHDFADAILKQFNVNAPLSRTTSTEWKKSRPSSAVRPTYSVLDITPFQKLTGHRTRHWSEALKDFGSMCQSA